MRKVPLLINRQASGEIEPTVGDNISFLCNGKGRGGHYRVYAKITKINQKTIAATENEGSYRPGTLWAIRQDSEFSVHKDTDR